MKNAFKAINFLKKHLVIAFKVFYYSKTPLLINKIGDSQNLTLIVCIEGCSSDSTLVTEISELKTVAAPDSHCN